LKSKAEVQRAALIEALVEMDDKLMEKYFAGEEITVEELKVALRKGTIEGKLFPVLGGDSITVMAKTILDYIAL
jgi:elongation factor G